MSQHGTPPENQPQESLAQGQQDLLNLASTVAEQAARAVVESTSFGMTQSGYQPMLSGQTRAQTQNQQARQAQAQQTQQAKQAQARQQASQQSQQPQQAQLSPSFSYQATSPQLSALQQQQAQAQTQQQYSPAVDVIEHSDEVHIFADLPGVDSDSIDVQASNSTISLSAERIESQQQADSGNPVMAERGRVMQRQIQLPAECDVDEASASWEKGVVTITLPKVESEATKQIGVE